jgi:hypothetical protein
MPKPENTASFRTAPVSALRFDLGLGTIAVRNPLSHLHAC